MTATFSPAQTAANEQSWAGVISPTPTDADLEAHGYYRDGALFIDSEPYRVLSIVPSGHNEWRMAMAERISLSQAPEEYILEPSDVRGYCSVMDVVDELPRAGVAAENSVYSHFSVQRMINEISAEIDGRLRGAGIELPLSTEEQSSFLQQLCLKGVVPRIMRGLYRDELALSRADQAEERYDADLMRLETNIDWLGGKIAENVTAPTTSPEPQTRLPGEWYG